MPLPSHLSAVILAGGKSRRMGQDKAALPLGDETLLARTVREVARLAQEVIVVGEPHGIPDLYPGTGPLGGVVTGLGAVSGNRALVVACDQPFLRAEALRVLADVVAGYDAAVPLIGDRPEPLHAVYGRDVWAVAERRVRRGELRLRDLLSELTVRWVSEEELRAVDPDMTSVRSVNTPDEWDAARARLGGRG